jgi:predicted DNA-binding transcriptional regulator YafY
MWSGAVLAERLGVGARTVRRDVERLRELGYEVDATPGSGGGYRLGGGKEVPPLLFDDEEAMAVAVVLGVSAGAAVPGIEKGALAALAKLDRLLPPRLRAQLTALRSTTVSLVTPGELVAADCLTHLAQACESHQRATFAYRAGDGKRSERRVEPHSLVATERRWYLVAYDLDRQDWRTFRLDRASSVKVTGHTFVPRPLSDPARLVAEAITAAPYLHRAVVRVSAPAEKVSRLVAADVGVVRQDGEGSLVELGADDFEWLTSYFVRLGFDFEVLEPAGLRDYVTTLAHRLLAHHGAPQLRGAGGPRRGAQAGARSTTPACPR